MNRKLLLLFGLCAFGARMNAQDWQWAKSLGNCGVAMDVADLISYGEGLLMNVNATSDGFVYEADGLQLEGQFFPGQTHAVVIQVDQKQQITWSLPLIHNSESAPAVTLHQIFKDQQDNFYITFIANSGLLQIGDEVINAGEGLGAFPYIAKFDAQKKLVWYTSFDPYNEANIFAWYDDEENRIYVGVERIEYGGQIYDPGYLLLTKFAPDGSVVWERKSGSVLGGINAEKAPGGNIYIIGTTMGAVKWENELIRSSKAPEDPFAFQILLDKDGNLLKAEVDIPAYLVEKVAINGSGYGITYTQDKETGRSIPQIFKKRERGDIVWKSALFSCNDAYADSRLTLTNRAKGSSFKKLIARGNQLFTVGLLPRFPSICIGQNSIDNPVAGDEEFPAYNMILLQMDTFGTITNYRLLEVSERIYPTHLLNGPAGEIIVVGTYQNTALQLGDQLLTNDCPALSYDPYGPEQKTPLIFMAAFTGDLTPIQEFPATPSTMLYPNPAQDELIICSDAFSEVLTQIQIFSTDGKLVNQQSAYPQGSRLRVETSALPPGMYVVRVMGNDQVSAQRFVKD